MMARKAKRPAATAAVDKQGARSRRSTTPATAAAPPGGSRGTRRLTKRELRGIIALKPEPFPEDDYLDGLAGSFSPEWIEQKKREHAEDAAYFGKMDEEYEAFRQRVINGVKEKGYYEVDANFLAGEGRPKGYVSKRFASMDSSEISRRFSPLSMSKLMVTMPTFVTRRMLSSVMEMMLMILKKEMTGAPTHEADVLTL